MHSSAHRVLAELCARYLNFFHSGADLMANPTTEASHHVDSHSLLDYSARYWSLHFREVCISNDNAAIAHIAAGISDSDSKVYSARLGIC